MNGAGVSPESPEPLELKAGEHAYAILKNRDFVFYTVGRFISSFGQQMLAGAVGWEIYDRTGSKLMLGYVGLVQVIPMFLFTFPAGHVADNYNRKHIILWMQLALCAAAGGLALVSWRELPVAWMYACLFVTGSARTYLWSATASLMPQLVSRRQFNRAVTWNSGLFQISAAVGPVAGLGIVAWTRGAAWVYAASVAAGLVCFALISMVKTHHRATAREQISLRNVVAGLKFIHRTKVILGSITLDMFAVLLGSATAILPAYAKDILMVGPAGLGWLKAALPLGSLLMSVILIHRPPLKKAGHTLLWSVVVFGVATIGFGVSRMFWLSFLMLFVSGMADYISVVVRHSIICSSAPPMKWVISRPGSWRNSRPRCSPWFQAASVLSWWWSSPRSAGRNCGNTAGWMRDRRR
jgi:MFS family permease